ncbi:hypothetical protein AVEN_49826-1 [Araneus ventricosus]|uniref:RNase H type-1 domain-containing protein n=1 Tax=Araneus ventricosus TaxID=182803 RepID=A0A4Y2JKG7_ARAVE|nr:hypothetical protein AVEN_49826-1 [Araneus ventricosus]
MYTRKERWAVQYFKKFDFEEELADGTLFEGETRRILSIQKHSNLGDKGHTWNSSSLPPAPSGGQSHSLSKSEHLTLTTPVPGEFEKGETGLTGHPSEFPTEKQFSLEDEDGRQNCKNINTVFQAELLAPKYATDHANSLSHQSITILVDNKESIQAAANPKIKNTTAGEICKSLITNKHIHISWIKAHVGYDGNGEADRLAIEAAESDRDPLSVKAPIMMEEKMMEDWQSDWEDEDTGRSTFNILLRVSTHPRCWEREEILFLQDMAIFPDTRKGLTLHRKQIGHEET